MFYTVSESRRLLLNHFARAQSAFGLFGMISKESHESAQSYSMCLKANTVQYTSGQMQNTAKLEET